jgi:hypothetical protein
MPEASPGRTHVFVSYSHADEEYLKRLRVHLALLERRNIKVWTDKDIEPGMNWQDEIKAALDKTKVAVLMISTDFLNSDFITKQELPPLLAAANSQGVKILPVLVKPSTFGDLDVEPLSCYQAVNMGRPLVKLKDDSEREEEFVRILQVIRKHMEGAPRPAPNSPPRLSPPAHAQALAPDECSEEQADQAQEFENEERDAGIALDEALAGDLEAMLNDPRAQALVIQVMNEQESADLMVVTEGRDGTVLLELLGNDELPPALQMDRNAQRHLVEQLGFNPPEIRGDRFWMPHGVDGDAIDVGAMTGLILAVLEDIFGVPNEDVEIGWQILEQ